MVRLRSLLGRLTLAGIAVTACADQPTLMEPEAVERPSFAAVTGELPVLSLGAPQPVTISRSRTIGPAGGSIQVGLLRLDVPAGALAEDVEITMTVPRGNFVQVQFAPHGLRFDRPATLSVNLAGTAAAGAAGALRQLQGVYFSGDDASDGSVSPLETFDLRVNGNGVEFDITHFSGYCVTGGRCDC